MEGSSIRISLGLAIRARPMASICCSPPERVPASWACRSASRGNRAKTSSRASRTRPGRRACRWPPSSRFSRTDRGLKSWRPSGTSTQPSSTIRSTAAPAMSCRSKSTCPPWGRSRPLAAFSRVVLPEP